MGTRGQSKRRLRARAFKTHEALCEGGGGCARAGNELLPRDAVRPVSKGGQGTKQTDGDAPPSALSAESALAANKQPGVGSQGETKPGGAKGRRPRRSLGEGLAPISKGGELEVESKPNRCTIRALDTQQTRGTSASSLCTSFKSR